MDLITTIMPVVTKDLPISPRFTPYGFLSRCITTRQPVVEFYLLTFPRFSLRKKEHKSYFGKNRTHDFRTSRCAGYLLPGRLLGRRADLIHHLSNNRSSAGMIGCYMRSDISLQYSFIQSIVVVVVVVVVFTLKTVLTSIQYPSLSYSSRQRNEFRWSQTNPK